MSMNAELQTRKDKVIPRGLGNMVPVYIDKADNAELWDVEGNRYIDFGAGIAVVNTGHNHPKVKAAVIKQLDKFTHTCFMVTPYESGVELAEKLIAKAPISEPSKAIYVTTGAEAVENCIKIARAYTGRRGVIAFNGGFHGRTNMAMGLTGKIVPYKHEFGPFPGDIYHAPYPIDYHNISIEQSLDSLKTLMKVAIAPDDVAAIIIEPVQGEGGFYEAPKEFLEALRVICDEHGIVLIADEIQTGYARTGKMFCMEHSGVEPDLITMAKGIAGGYPLAAVVGKAHMMDAPSPGGLGGTYAGSPVSIAAALAVLDVIEEQDLINRAVEIGDAFIGRLNSFKETYPHTIGNVRNTGAMIAMELVEEGDANKPNPLLAKALVIAASKKGLILLSCGSRGNVIRFLPPLTISDELINEGLDIVNSCLQEAKID
jgi:4-aminobutyrate aminotransferase/(S)-3-amino-2-methylpropionate transaminase